MAQPVDAARQLIQAITDNLNPAIPADQAIQNVQAAAQNAHDAIENAGGDYHGTFAQA
jgi:hypothetical protein